MGSEISGGIMAYSIKEKLDAVNALLKYSSDGERMSSILKKNGFTTEQISSLRENHMEEYVDQILYEFSQLICDVAYDVLLSD